MRTRKTHEHDRQVHDAIRYPGPDDVNMRRVVESKHWEGGWSATRDQRCFEARDWAGRATSVQVGRVVFRYTVGRRIEGAARG